MEDPHVLGYCGERLYRGATVQHSTGWYGTILSFSSSNPVVAVVRAERTKQKRLFKKPITRSVPAHTLTRVIPFDMDYQQQTH